MVKLRNLCLRLSSLGLAACLIFALCVPVSAVSLDFWDLNPVLQNLGDDTLVKVSIPNEYCYSVSKLSDGSVIRGGSSFSYSLPPSFSVSMDFYPFGYPWEPYTDSLSLADIPSGTSVSFLFDWDMYPSFVNVSFRTGISYYKGDTKLAEQSDLITISSGGQFLFDFVLNYPDGADTAIVKFTFAVSNGSSIESYVSYSLLSTTLSMTLDSLLVQQQQTGRTNAILQKVEQQLADQGQTLDDVLKEQQDTNDKLDDIINGTVEPSSPAGSDSVGDLTDQEDQLLQDMNPGFDAMDNLQADVLEQIVGYAMSLNAVSWLLDRFISIPFIYIILAISLSLGLTGTILGLFNTIASRYRSDARDWKNYQNRMGRSRRKGG